MLKDGCYANKCLLFNSSINQDGIIVGFQKYINVSIAKLVITIHAQKSIFTLSYL